MLEIAASIILVFILIASMVGLLLTPLAALGSFFVTMAHIRGNSIVRFILVAKNALYMLLVFVVGAINPWALWLNVGIQPALSRLVQNKTAKETGFDIGFLLLVELVILVSFVVFVTLAWTMLGDI